MHDDVRQDMHRRLVEAMPGDAYIAYDVDPSALEAVRTLPGTGVAVVTRHPWRGHRWVAAYAADPADEQHVAAATDLAVELVRRSQSEGPVKGSRSRAAASRCCPRTCARPPGTTGTAGPRRPRRALSRRPTAMPRA